MAFAKPTPLKPWKRGSQNFLDMAKKLNARGFDYNIIKQMTGDMISIQEQMIFEGNRLCSFQAWPTNAKAYTFQLA